MGDSEVSALGWLLRLSELQLSPAPRPQRRAEHAHYTQVPLSTPPHYSHVPPYPPLIPPPLAVTPHYSQVPLPTPPTTRRHPSLLPPLLVGTPQYSRLCSRHCTPYCPPLLTPLLSTLHYLQAPPPKHTKHKKKLHFYKIKLKRNEVLIN